MRQLSVFIVGQGVGPSPCAIITESIHPGCPTFLKQWATALLMTVKWASAPLHIVHIQHSPPQSNFRAYMFLWFLKRKIWILNQWSVSVARPPPPPQGKLLWKPWKWKMWRIKNMHFYRVMLDGLTLLRIESGKAKLWIKEECLSSPPQGYKFWDKYKSGKNVNKNNYTAAKLATQESAWIDQK